MLKNLKKLSFMSALGIALSFGIVMPVAAHVVVRPGEAITSSRGTYSVSVPNEHDTPVVAVRLEIPAGLTSVRPFAKPGWDISVLKQGEGENVTATEITWTSAGGTVPVDLKDDFLFGAMAPAEPTELKWRAYETYQDGTVVAWVQDPSEEEGNKPYSVTKVVAETEAAQSLAKAEQAAVDASKAADQAMYTAVIAAVLGIAGIALALRKK